MKHTIFFDLGNVLIFFSHEKMYQQVSEYCGLRLNIVQSLIDEYSDSYARGAITNHIIFEKLCQLSPRKLHLEALLHAMGNIFEPNNPVISIALKLKEKGHRLFILSNTCDAHFNFAFSQFPFLKSFDGYVLSYQVGACKPEKAIYEKALKIARCEKEECFYTDDILSYIEAARSLNIDAEQYQTPHDLMNQLNLRKIL